MRYLIAFAAALLSGPLFAQDTQQLVGRIIFEDDPNRTLISKPGWLRGLHFMGEELEETQRPSIVANIRQPEEDGFLCARLTSISGNYEAIVEFPIKGAAENSEPETIRHNLSFPSKFPKIIESVTPLDGGITLSRGKCTGDTLEAPNYIATYWNNTADPLSGETADVSLALNMNVARADRILPKFAMVELDDRGEPVKDAQGAPVTQRLTNGVFCEEINELGALAFNYRCHVTVPRAKLTSPAGAQVMFSYVAEYRGRNSPERSAMIEIGAFR